MIKTSLVILCAAAMMTSCGGKDKKGEGKNEPETKMEVTTPSADATKLEGVWEVKREDGDPASQTVGSTYEFKGNKLTTGKDGFYIPGSTEVTDNTFSFLADGGTEKDMYNYHFDGDTLVISFGPQVFHLLKK